MAFTTTELPTGEIAATYAEYLQTRYWTLLKDLYLKLFGDFFSGPGTIFCDCCSEHFRQYIELHHMTYDNLGNMEEELFDIQKVCRKCHGMIHARDMMRFNDPLQAFKETRKIRFKERRQEMDSALDFNSSIRRVDCIPDNCDNRAEIIQQVEDYIQQGLLSERFMLEQIT